MRLLGIDYGTKRVGIALSDDTGSVAFPHATIPNDKALFATLLELVRGKEIGGIVVGESKAPDGSDNPVMKGVRGLVEELKKETGIPVYLESEFYTSFEARRDLNKSLVDAEAASIILNSYLQRTKPYADNN